MTVTEALQLIEKNEHMTALSYCTTYAAHALRLIDIGNIVITSDGHTGWISNDLKIQLLHVLTNMTRWRQCKASTTTAAEIKECRAVLKKASL